METRSGAGVALTTRLLTPGVSLMPEKRTTCTCLTCGKNFESLSGRSKYGVRKYCSHKCSGVAKTFVIERDFPSLVDRSGGPDACWPWTGRFEWGYGRFTSSYRQYFAHRVAWAMAHGVAVDDAPPLIRHMCPGGGNSWCCNPRHLAPGTSQDNVADRVKAGRSAFGEKNGKARLTADQVREIRRRADSGESAAVLGRAFGVSWTTANRIVCRSSWRHIA